MLTEQQIENRKQGLGGSDAAAIIGASTYKTPYDIYQEKTGFTEKYLETPDQRRGRILESLVRTLYEIKTGSHVTLIQDTLRHKEYPFILGHVDGFVKSENILCEFKTTRMSQRALWGEEGSDDIPLNYRIQCAHYAAVMDVNRVDIGLLIGTDDYLDYLVSTIDEIDPYKIVSTSNFRIYHYYRVAPIETRLLEREKGFWNDNVTKRIPPLFQTQEDILSMFPQTDNTVLTAKEEHLDLIGRLNALQCIIKKLEGEYASIKMKNCALMGPSSGVADITGQKLLMWTNEKYAHFNLQEFKNAHPDLYASFLTEKDKRVLRQKADAYQKLYPELFQTFLSEYQTRFLQAH